MLFVVLCLLAQWLPIWPNNRYSRGAGRSYHAPLLGLNPMHVLLYSGG